jgi:hypothetical protein
MSGVHIYSLGGEAGSHRGCLRYIHVLCDRLGIRSCKPLVVNVCTLVFVYGGIVCLVVEGIHVGTEGEWVRYIRRMLSVTSTLLHVQYLK